jgi:hypothetical protein
MNIKMITRIILILLWAASNGCASTRLNSPKSGSTTQVLIEQEKNDPLDTALEQLNKTTDQLESYQCQIEYKFVQPALFDSQDLRKGMLYYSKEPNKTRMRVNFLTRKQDEEAEHKYLEQYIVLDGSSLKYPDEKFEGTWLVCIDYQVKELKLVQLAKPAESDKQVDLFELASRNLPIIGFTKIENLKEQFNVSLVEQKNKESQDFIQVHLDVKPNSVYKNDYTYIDFWIDKKLNLPAKVFAETTEKDFYEIKFLKPKINKKIDKKIFDFKMPKGFSEPEIIPLKEKDNQ